jgi:MFS family permease
MRYPNDFDTALFVVGAIATAQTVLGFTLPLLALELTGEGTGLALIKGAGFVPNILFAVFVGVANDRLSKAAAFRRYAAGLALATGMLMAAAWTDRLSLPGLATFVVVFNALAYATGNAQMTLIRLTVDEARLSDATALVSTVHAVITTAGPAVAGFALLQLGHAGVIAACALLMALTAIGTLALDPPEDLPPPAPFWPALREGWHVLSANRELVAMTVVIVLTNAAEGAYATALILKLKAGGADAFEIGIVLAAAGVGAVLASRVAAPARRRFGYRTAFFWPIWGLAALYLAVALDWPLVVLGALSFVEGGLSLFFAIGVWSYRQESTAARHMGRVAGLTGAIFKIGMPPVILLSGILSDAGNLAAVFALAAAINVGAALYLAYPARWGWPRTG